MGAAGEETATCEVYRAIEDPADDQCGGACSVVMTVPRYPSLAAVVDDPPAAPVRWADRRRRNLTQPVLVCEAEHSRRARGSSGALTEGGFSAPNSTSTGPGR